MSSAADRYAAVYDAVVASDHFVDHRMPGDHWAEMAEMFRLDPKRRRDAYLTALAGYLEPSDVLLDVGGGAGRISLALADSVTEVVLIEPSEGMRGQFASARDQAGITNTRITPDWWMDSHETGDVIHLSDVTYFVRDIAPFVAKLHNSASRSVIIGVWRPAPGDMASDLRELATGERPPRWPALPELAAVLWEMGLLPDIRILPDEPWWLTDEERNLSEPGAIDLATRWLNSEDSEVRATVSRNLDRLFARTPEGLTPRWLSEPRAALLTWETGGIPLDIPPNIPGG